MIASIGLALLVCGWFIQKGWGNELAGLGPDWWDAADWLGGLLKIVGGAMLLASLCMWLWKFAP